MYLNLPNILSLLRVVISPFFLYFLISDDPQLVQFACYLYVIGGLTDYADGWLARKMNLITTWGVFFDPLADKILTTSAFVGFSILNLMPWYIVAIVLIRDILTTLMRIIAENNNQHIKTSNSAKLKTFLQMTIIGIVLTLIFFKSIGLEILFGLNINQILNSAYFHLIFIVLMVFTVWTLMEYLVQNKTIFVTILSKKVRKT